MESDASKFCQKVMAEIDSARTNPKAFAEKLRTMMKSFDGKVLRLPGTKVGLTTNEGAAAFEEAAVFLTKLNPLPAMIIDQGLCEAASAVTEKFKTCKDMNEMQKINQTSLIAQKGSFEGESGLSTDFGSSTPEMVCMNLVVDDGDKGRHNRAMMFKTGFKTIGCATISHDQFRSCTVILYANKFIKGKVVVNKKVVNQSEEGFMEEALSDNIREIHNTQAGENYW